MNILVFGVQGSGKSTHAKYISSMLGLPYIYSGDLFRSLEDETSDRGEKIRQLLKKGNLIPDEIAIPAFEEYLGKINTSRGVVLDGFPRTLEQAETLKIGLDLIVHITLPTKLIIERLLDRGRSDDNPESMMKRIELYEEKTTPILDFFKLQKVRVVIIDNTPPVKEVKKKIDDLLKI